MIYAVIDTNVLVAAVKTTKPDSSSSQILSLVFTGVIRPLVSSGGLKRLAFLRVAFALYDIKRTTVAEDLGLNITGVNRWFRVDDMSISYIFKIAELYGLKVRITATPKKGG